MSNNEAEFTEENEDDITAAELVEESTESVDLESIDEYKEALQKCTLESENYLDGWQRSKADFVNLKKRAAEDVSRIQSRATEGFVESLLPTLDSFDMAFKDKDAWEQAPEQWRKGVEYIYSQLQTVVDSYGVKTVGNTGETFDHKIHEPVESISVESEDQDNVIQEVVRSGYTLNDSVIRPAHVKVGSFSKD